MRKPTLPTLPAVTPVHAVDLLDKVAVCKRLNVSVRALENMVKDDTFPPPVRASRKVYWSETAVYRWQQRLFAAQEAWQPR